MIKQFCDGCGEEIKRNYVTDRLKRTFQLEGTPFHIEVMAGKSNVTNDGDLCLDCLMKVINEGRER